MPAGGPSDDDAGGDGGVGGLVDENELAGQPVAGIGVVVDGLRGAYAHATDVVETQPGGVLVALEGVRSGGRRRR